MAMVIGGLRGFIKEIFSLAFWLLATWVGLRFNREFSVFLQSSVNPPSARLAASFVALLVITLAFGALIGCLSGVLLKKDELNFIHRFGGMVSGLVRGILVVIVVIIVARLTPLSKDSWWNESLLIPPVQSFALSLRDPISSDPARLIATSSANSYKTIQVKK